MAPDPRRHACRTLFLPITSKDRNAPFIHLQDCPGLLLIYEVVPIVPPSPRAALTRLCVLPLFLSHGLELQMGRLCLARGVRHTPPLILPSESLRRTMANICGPPKCSIRLKRPVGMGGWGEVLNTEAAVNAEKQCHVFTHVCQPLVLGLCELVSLMVGVLCLLRWITPTPFSAPRTDWVHTRTHRHEHTSNLVTWL